MQYFEEKLVEALFRAGSLEGVSCERCGDDEVSVEARHLNDYLLVTNIGKMIAQGKMKIEIAPSERDFLFRLLKIK